MATLRAEMSPLMAALCKALALAPILQRAIDPHACSEVTAVGRPWQPTGRRRTLKQRYLMIRPVPSGVEPQGRWEATQLPTASARLPIACSDSARACAAPLCSVQGRGSLWGSCSERWNI